MCLMPVVNDSPIYITTFMCLMPVVNDSPIHITNCICLKPVVNDYSIYITSFVCFRTMMQNLLSQLTLKYNDIYYKVYIGRRIKVLDVGYIFVEILYERKVYMGKSSSPMES